MDVNYQFDRTATVQSQHYETIFPAAIGATSGSIATAEDYAICREIMRKASRNYSSASNYLPPQVQPHVEALYALMRVGDDRVDINHAGFQSPLEAIDDWEREYWSAHETGGSPHPVLRAYLDTARKFGIPSETMAPYFRAMRDDLSITRFPTFQDLVHYMDGSAAPVGRAMTYILGVNPPNTIRDALPGADSLSFAMQLSNFWRDIGEDYQRGRIYLPLADMDYFNVSENDLTKGHITTAFINLLEFEFERTEIYYQTARPSVKMLASGQVAVMSALEIYRAIIDGIRANRYDVFNHRAGTGRLRKLSLVARAYWKVR